jgi:tetratricopeptide (TPR) repeat protein
LEHVIDTAAIRAEVEALVHQGKHFQALQLAQRRWGPHQHWRHLEQLLLGGTLFSQLGLRRKTLACRLRAWRLAPQDHRVIYYYVAGLLERRGPLKALGLIKRFPSMEQADTELRAEWLALKANVYAHYRDWETADSLMQQALALAPHNTWVQVEKATLLERQDNYAAAWDTLAPLIAGRHQQAILFGAYLKTLTNERDAAIAMLQEGMEQIESISIPLRLSRLYQESQRWQDARACLERAQTFVPDTRDLEQNLAIANYEQAMADADLQRAATALTSVRSGFYKIVAENLLRADNSKKQVLLEVPFVRQHHMTCAPATLSALFQYWQQDANHLDIVEAICYDGTPNHAERSWAIQQGWKVREFCLETETAHALIDRGVPFTLSTVEPGSAHLQAVVGYDQRRGIYLVRDPYYPSVLEFLSQETGEYYRSSGPRCLALVPAAQEHLLDGITYPDRELYDAYFELQEALDQHQRKQAQQWFQHMQTQQAEHRLTLMAERSLARYDGDPLRELDIVERLILLFPQDLNLQVSKAGLLGRLGRFQEKIEYLDQQVHQAQPNPHPLLVQQLAGALAQDHRLGERAKEHLRYVLYRQPTNAAALWTLAGTHWDLAEYEQAFEYYRLCSTLEDKHEGYVTSFFRAARYLKQTDKALKRLQQRIEHFGHKSIYPYESLHFALRELSRYGESITVLEQALIAHPDNGELIARLARAYISNGQVNDAIQLCNQHKDHLSELERLHLAAEVAEYRNQWQKQVEYQDQILKRQPLNHYIIQNQATLIGRHQGDHAAIAFVERCLALNPRDRDLLFLKLDWMYNQPLAEREAFARTIVGLHPRDCDSYVRLARIQQQQRELNAAETSAITACEINPYDRDATITLGDIYLLQEKESEAHALFRTVLNRSVDADDIFRRLLRCCSDFEAKQAELRCILDQLMQQTSYGNGILEYLEVARDLVRDEELLSFLELACELRPDLWQSWLARAMHLKTMDRLDDAIKIANEAKRRFPLLPRIYLESSQILFVARKFDEALRDAQEALRQNPRWMSAITQSLTILEAQGRHEESLKQLQAALVHMPTSAILHGYLADALMLLGQREEALDAVEKALQLDAYYEWAWDRFTQLARGTERAERPLRLAQEILQTQPHNVVVWQKCIELEPDFAAKMRLLDNALALHPKHEGLNLLRCNTLFDAHQIKQIKSFVHDPKWKGNSPAALLGFEAWVDAQYQRFDEAITMMKSVVEHHPYHYDGWRLLAQWSRRIHQYDAAVRYANTCIRLAPHTPGALTLAAEIYLEAVKQGVTVAEGKIGECLEKAVVLDPRNQYNGLTWLDYLIEKRDWMAVERARGIIHCDKDNPYFLVRYLQASMGKGLVAVASELFDQLMRCPQDNPWLFETAYQAFVREELWDRLRKHLQACVNDPDCNPITGRLWAQYCLDRESKRSTILDYLKPFPAGSDRWRQAMEAIFAKQDYHQTADLVLSKFKQAAKEDPRVWSLVTFHHSRRQDWRNLRRWCADGWQRSDNNAWAVYLYGYGLRLAGNWRESARVNEYAAQLPADDYYDRIILWQLHADSLANNKPVDTDRLARIRFNELAALEQYLWRLIQTLHQVQHQGLPAARQDMIKRFREARKLHRDVSSSQVGQQVHRHVRRRIVGHSGGSILEKAWLSLQLFLLR